MFEKLKIVLFVVIGILVILFLFPLKSIPSYIRYSLYSKNDLRIYLSTVNPQVTTVAADPSDKLVMRVIVRNTSGLPIPNAHVKLSVQNNTGSIYPSDARTDEYGECLATYIPPSKQVNDNENIKIQANIYGSTSISTVNVSLINTPIIFVHGYQENAEIFANMKEFLSSKGFTGAVLSYKSENGVVAASKDLDLFLHKQKMLLLSKGIQVEKFDVIAHSMGGLVTRYYTTTEDYNRNDDIRKIIFVSVPHKGSPWASLGEAYIHDKGIQDLKPDSQLISRTLPGLNNKGLNSSIQVGNIAAQFDEVVDLDSASLEEWNIKTEIFNVGDNNFSVDNLLNGKILNASNHKTILSNKKVFNRLLEMLKSYLPRPTVVK